jgi:hypothetical protein
MIICKGRCGESEGSDVIGRRFEAEFEMKLVKRFREGRDGVEGV